MFYGPVAGRNPWNANTLEWTAPSPPGHGNFDFQPVVYRGPYEFSVPGCEKDHLMQTDPPHPAEVAAAAAAHAHA